MTIAGDQRPVRGAGLGRNVTSLLSDTRSYPLRQRRLAPYALIMAQRRPESTVGPRLQGGPDVTARARDRDLEGIVAK
jgi:hypothetical protein